MYGVNIRDVTIVDTIDLSRLLQAR